MRRSLWVVLSFGALLVGLSAGAPHHLGHAKARNVARVMLADSRQERAARPLTDASVMWCGEGETPDNRLPQHDAFAPSTVRVLYVYPADVPDRFLDVAELIVADIAAIDAWWQRQDPSRAPRWDTFAFPGCAPGLQSLDLGVLGLAHDDAYYGAATGYQRLMAEIAPHLGPTEKALVFFDGAAIEPNVCGVSEMAARNGGRYGISVISLRSGCRVDLGAGLVTARIAAHELVHNLGAVPRKAPGLCGDSALGGHTCDSPTDLMFPYASADMRLPDAVLDSGRDDYYAHTGDWWDVQDSAWLVHLPYRTLAVAIVGPGSVTSSPAVIACPGSCAAALESDVGIRLEALAGRGAEFYGWGGTCGGSPSCTVTMTGNLSLRAVFGAPRATLTVSVTGRGRVTSAPPGIDCPGRCAARYPKQTAVTLRARPSAGWRLLHWVPAHGSKSTSVFRVTADRRVTAVFVKQHKTR